MALILSKTHDKAESTARFAWQFQRQKGQPAHPAAQITYCAMGIPP